MEIILMRHGMPAMASFAPIRLTELPRMIADYNATGLAETSIPPDRLLKIASGCNAVVCSDLPRSIASADALGAQSIDLIDPLFREVDLPHAQFISPRLKPQTWAAIFRLLWLAGYSKNGEAINETRKRAALVAKTLTGLAENHGSVLLAGHGLFNRFIARELRSSGWRGPANPGWRYWEFGIYRMI